VIEPLFLFKPESSSLFSRVFFCHPNRSCKYQIPMAQIPSPVKTSDCALLELAPTAISNSRLLDYPSLSNPDRQMKTQAGELCFPLHIRSSNVDICSVPIRKKDNAIKNRERQWMELCSFLTGSTLRVTRVVSHPHSCTDRCLRFPWIVE
jgi:hypothetical protein